MYLTVTLNNHSIGTRGRTAITNSFGLANDTLTGGYGLVAGLPVTTNRNLRVKVFPPLNGEVEAVEMSDPERAPSRE